MDTTGLDLESENPKRVELRKYEYKLDLGLKIATFNLAKQKTVAASDSLSHLRHVTPYEAHKSI